MTFAVFFRTGDCLQGPESGFDRGPHDIQSHAPPPAQAHWATLSSGAARRRSGRVLCTSSFSSQPRRALADAQSLQIGEVERVLWASGIDADQTRFLRLRHPALRWSSVASRAFWVVVLSYEKAATRDFAWRMKLPATVTLPDVGNRLQEGVSASAYCAATASLNGAARLAMRFHRLQDVELRLSRRRPGQGAVCGRRAPPGANCSTVIHLKGSGCVIIRVLPAEPRQPRAMVSRPCCDVHGRA